MPAVAEKENTLVSQLEKTLRSRAAHLAIKSKSSELTYADLDNLSARCAGALQRESANRFAPIALMMSHDAHLIAAIVGILRSGGFYFVLNRSLPPARLREIVKEVRPWAIVADSEHAEQARKLSSSTAKIFCFDELLTKAGSFSSAPANENSPSAIFYTSGSSQRPRPLVYTHGGTWHNVTNHSRSLRITADDRITLLSPCSAAASVSAIFGALLNDASLFLFDPVGEGLPKLRDWIRTERITVYHSVPSLFRRFAEAHEPDEILHSVRMVKLGGGPVFPPDADGVLDHLGRKDDQLKLRGHWISVAEIEAALMEVSGVRDAAVLAIERDADAKNIIAFVSWTNGELTEQELRSALQRRLPVYTLPQRVFGLSQLPLLPNGKIDRVALSHEAARRIKNKTHSPAVPGDALSCQLVRIWENILGTNNVDTTSDFFALGGDSLAAATMLAAVETFFGIHLPVSALVEAPTLEKLAEVIRHGGWSEAQLRLVALQLRGTKPPLYCVPGAGSEALAFRELAAHLGNDQPCFAFQPQGLDGCAPYLDSIEEMATHHITSLRHHQPRGPYYLCGSSLGGVVAFEMARCLSQDGEKVQFLGLLDTYGGEFPKVRKGLSEIRPHKYRGGQEI